MIKKAVKRPDEVEYIEFKGRENFEEVCEFTGRNLKYVVNSFGVEHIAYGDQLFIKPGYIFYRDVNEEKPEFQVATKDEFFRRYKED